MRTWTRRFISPGGEAAKAACISASAILSGLQEPRHGILGEDELGLSIVLQGNESSHGHGAEYRKAHPTSPFGELGAARSSASRSRSEPSSDRASVA